MAEATNTVTLVAEESRNLDTICYRGTAPLWCLTRISQVDVFDQDSNPNGLQRDLSRKHALDAYDYAAREPNKHTPRAYPEVLLNVRDKKVVDLDRHTVELGGQHLNLATITIDLDKIDTAKSVKISRVDGNHRLFFGNGDGKERGPLDVSVPFSLTLGLTREQETGIFTDINAEQKGLNTSHLAIMRSRLTPAEIEFDQHPARAYAKRLVDDEASPWFDMVHMGGSKTGAVWKDDEGKTHKLRRPVNFVALQSGIHRILRKSQYLTDLSTIDARYGLLRNYWQAVRVAYPEAWEDGNELLILKNIGVNVFCEAGATIIDRSMAAQAVEVEDMASFLVASKDAVDWHKDSPDVAGMSGNRAALALASRMIEKMPKTPDQSLVSAVATRDAA